MRKEKDHRLQKGSSDMKLETKPFEEYDFKKFKNHYYVRYIDRISVKREFVKSHPMTELSVKSYDGLTLKGDYCDMGSDKTAILFHGFNAEV